MQIIKFFALLLLLTINQTGLLAQKKEKQENVVFFSDTTFKFGDCTFEFTHSYSKLLFFKTKLYITGSSDKFIVFPSDSIFIKTPESDRAWVHPNRRLVAAPGHTYRYKLRFDGLKFKEEQIHFYINQVQTSGQKTGVYDPFRIKIETKVVPKYGNLKLEVLKISRGGLKYKIRIKIINTKEENFLAIDFTKIYIKTADGKIVYNTVKPYHRMHHEPNGYSEMALLVFPIDENTKIDRYIYFEDVFAEYLLKDIPGLKLHAVLNANNRQIDPASFEEKEKADKADEKNED